MHLPRQGIARLSRMFSMAATLALSPTAWGLSGTLLDNTGKPLDGATVELVLAGKTATTTSAGFFSFDLQTGIQGRSISALAASQPTLSGNAIHFTATEAGSAKIAIHTFDGRRVHSFQTPVAPGYHALALDGGGRMLARGMYLVTFEAGGVGKTFRYFRAENPLSTSSTSSGTFAASVLAARSAASLAAVDTLVVAKTVGEVTSSRKILVHAYDDSINTYIAGGKQILILDPSNDNDGDGLTNYEERFLYSTNAELADTDGDGVDDATEIKDSRSPLVADIPSISFEALEYPVIRANYAKTIGSSTSKDISTGGEYSQTSTFSSQQEVNASLEIAVMVGGEIDLSATGGAKINGSVTTTIGAGFSQTWSQETSTSMTKNWSEAISTATSNETSISGGDISINVRIYNNSKQDFTLVNPIVRLTTTSFQSGNLGTKIGELFLVDDDKEILVSCESGKNYVDRIFKTDLPNPDLLEEIAQLSSGLVAELTNIKFRVSVAEIDTLMSNVYRRTAEVIVDPGWYSSQPLVKKRVAKRNLYNEFYTSQQDRYKGATLAKVLETAGSTPTLDSTDGRFGIKAIGGLKNGDFSKGVWSAVIQTSSDSVMAYSSSFASYDPRRIEVDTASVVSVLYSADQDGDGLPGRLEAVLGTSDTVVDSDHDGLGDGQEYSGWSRAGSNQVWKTNPLLPDTDCDSLVDTADADPLTARKSSQDSAVSVTEISLSSLQGTTWKRTGDVTDAASYAVSEIMRGPATISLTFTHAVSRIAISRNSTIDTVLTTPDQGESTAFTYSVPLKLLIGDNSLAVTIVSKSGTASKKIGLTGISRRLIRIPGDTTLFNVVVPVSNLQHKARKVFVDYDKIKALDPLVTEVVVFRTSTFAAPIPADSIATLVATADLGDAGNNSFATLNSNDSLRGSSGSAKYFAVSHIFTSTANITDSSLKRDHDYAFFAYASHGEISTRFLTGPAENAKREKMNRNLVIDSVTLWQNCLRNWGAGLVWSAWKTISRAKITIGTWDTATGTGDVWLQSSGLLTNNPQVGRYNIRVGKILADSTPILFPKNTNWADGLDAQFIRQDVATWLTSATLPKTIYTYNLTHPGIHALSDWTWIDAAATTDAIPVGKKWRHTTINPTNDPAAQYQLFDCEFKINWSYEVGPANE
jgi:hypothetical protein